MEWSQWAQQIGGLVIDRASAAKYVHPYALRQQRIQAMGEGGLMYEAGKPAQTAGPDTQTMLIVGGAVLVLVLLARG